MKRMTSTRSPMSQCEGSPTSSAISDGCHPRTIVAIVVLCLLEHQPRQGLAPVLLGVDDVLGTQRPALAEKPGDALFVGGAVGAMVIVVYLEHERDHIRRGAAEFIVD